MKPSDNVCRKFCMFTGALVLLVVAFVMWQLHSTGYYSEGLDALLRYSLLFSFGSFACFGAKCAVEHCVECMSSGGDYRP